MNHYVYILIDPRTEVPFYVGKGQGNRMYAHEVEARSSYWYNQPKCQQIVDIWADSLIVQYQQITCESDEAARLLEIELIQTLGRKCSSTGPLTNIHPGGSGFGRCGVIVYQFDLHGALIEVHQSVSAASSKTGIAISAISANCRGKQRSSGSYVWSYSNEDIQPYVRISEKRKVVFQFSMNGEFISKYPDAATACIALSYCTNAATKISAVCVNKLHSYSGFIWSYDEVQPLPRPHQKKSIIQIDPITNNVVNEYVSISEAVRVTAITSISLCCNGKQRTAGGYIWNFKQ